MEKKQTILYKEVKANLNLALNRVLVTKNQPNKFLLRTQTNIGLGLLSLSPQIGFKNMEGVEHVPLTKDKAVQLVKDVFISAAERDVYTGDALRVCVITKEGINEETIPLRKD